MPVAFVEGQEAFVRRKADSARKMSAAELRPPSYREFGSDIGTPAPQGAGVFALPLRFDARRAYARPKLGAHTKFQIEDHRRVARRRPAGPNIGRTSENRSRLRHSHGGADVSDKGLQAPVAQTPSVAARPSQTANRAPEGLGPPAAKSPGIASASQGARLKTVRTTTWPRSCRKRQRRRHGNVLPAMGKSSRSRLRQKPGHRRRQGDAGRQPSSALLRH